MTDRHPIVGDSRVVSRMHEESVKGNLLAARFRYVREQYGDAALDALYEKLPPDLAHRLHTSILPFAWYPFNEMLEIDRRIIEGPMQGRVELMEHFGATIARYDLPTVYKMLFRFGSPSFVVKRINIAYKTYLRPGSAQAEDVESGRARITFADAVYPEYFCRHGISGWLRAAVELSGANQVQISHVSCLHDGDERCRWHLSWS